MCCPHSPKKKKKILDILLQYYRQKYKCEILEVQQPTFLWALRWMRSRRKWLTQKSFYDQIIYNLETLNGRSKDGQITTSRSLKSKVSHVSGNIRRNMWILWPFNQIYALEELMQHRGINNCPLKLYFFFFKENESIK